MKMSVPNENESNKADVRVFGFLEFCFLFRRNKVEFISIKLLMGRIMHTLV